MDWNKLFEDFQAAIRVAAEDARKSAALDADGKLDMGDGEAGSTVRLEPIDAKTTTIILDARINVTVPLAEILRDLKIKPESPFPARLEGKGFALDI